MPGPLHGVKVIDFTEIIAGPMGGRLLADMGAEVIKVEPPWGEPWRFSQKFAATESRGFMAFNRGKMSLPLNLTKPEAQKIVHRLVKDADVSLMNYRPDVAAKLGVDYETLSALNPRLIYCEITAFGRQGPDSHRPGYDMILQAMSGLMAAETKVADGVPQQISSSPVIDITTGFSLAWCVCGALYARERTGRGQKVETSLLASSMGLLSSRLSQVDKLDTENRKRALEQLEAKRAEGASYQELLDASPASRRQRHHGNVYYRVYETKDGQIAVGCLSDPLRRRLADTLGLTDPRLDAGFHIDTPETQAIGIDMEKQAVVLFREKTSEEWLTLLEGRGIPAGPMRFVEELFEDPQIRANELLTEVEHHEAGTVTTMGAVAKFSDTPFEVDSASPALGQHSEGILLDLGYSKSEIKEWREAGIVG